MSKREEIDKILKERPDLKSEYVYNRDPEFVKKVLSMKEWEDPKFQGLLTPTIWKSKAKEIKEILTNYEIITLKEMNSRVLQLS